VDGSAATVRPGERFSVPWPRATTRRGAIALRRTAQIEDGPKVRLEQLECGGDAITLRYVAPGPVDVRLSADGARVPVLDAMFDDEGKAGSVTAYPLLKSQASLTIEIRGAPAVEVALP
jgi:hypothetical protein